MPRFDAARRTFFRNSSPGPSSPSTISLKPPSIHLAKKKHFARNDIVLVEGSTHLKQCHTEAKEDIESKFYVNNMSIHDCLAQFVMGICNFGYELLTVANMIKRYQGTLNFCNQVETLYFLKILFIDLPKFQTLSVEERISPTVGRSIETTFPWPLVEMAEFEFGAGRYLTDKKLLLIIVNIPVSQSDFSILKETLHVIVGNVAAIENLFLLSSSGNEIGHNSVAIVQLASLSDIDLAKLMINRLFWPINGILVDGEIQEFECVRLQCDIFGNYAIQSSVVQQKSERLAGSDDIFKLNRDANHISQILGKFEKLLWTFVDCVLSPDVKSCCDVDTIDEYTSSLKEFDLDPQNQRSFFLLKGEISSIKFVIDYLRFNTYDDNGDSRGVCFTSSLKLLKEYLNLLEVCDFRLTKEKVVRVPRDSELELLKILHKLTTLLAITLIKDLKRTEEQFASKVKVLLQDAARYQHKQHVLHQRIYGLEDSLCRMRENISDYQRMLECTSLSMEKIRKEKDDAWSIVSKQKYKIREQRLLVAKLKQDLECQKKCPCCTVESQETYHATSSDEELFDHFAKSLIIEDLILENMDVNHLNTLQASIDALSSKVKNIKEEKIRKITKELERTKQASEENMQCCICRDEPKTVLLLPCRHLCLCEACAQHLDRGLLTECPVCREYINDKIKVYA